MRSVSWCPNQALSLVAVAADRKVLLVNPGIGDHVISSKTDLLLEEAPEHDSVCEYLAISRQQLELSCVLSVFKCV